MKISVVNCFVHTLCLVLVFLVLETSSKECGDPKCESVIAKGRAVLRFRGGGEKKVNLDQNEAVDILAKNIGKDKEFLVRKATGKIGLAPKDFIREVSIVIKSIDRVKVDDTVDTSLDIKPTQPVTEEEKVLQTTVVEGTVLTNDVLSDSSSVEPAAIDAPSSVKSTPTLEVVPSTQPVEDNLPNGADVSKNETVEENDDDSEELLEAEDTEEDEEEEEGEDVSEEDEDDAPDTNNEVEKEEAEDNNADDVSGEATTAEGPKTEVTSEEVLPNDGQDDAKRPQAVAEEIQSKPDDSVQNTSESVPSTNQINIQPSVKDNEDIEQQPGADKVDENVTEDSTTVTEQATQSDDKSTETDENFNGLSVSGSVQMEPENSTDATTENPTASENDPPSEMVTQQPVVTQVVQDSPTMDSVSIADEVTTPLSIVEMTETEVPVTMLPPEVVTDVVQPLPAEPAPVTETEDAPSTVETSKYSDSQPTPPSRILGGGLVPAENGYCDSTGIDCPPPTAPHVPPSIKQSNGGSDYNPMDRDVHNNEKEPEQPQHMAPDDRTEHLQDVFGGEKQEQLTGDYIEVFVQEALKLSDLILMLAITSFTLLVFSLGHYLINKNRREKPLIYKLNMIERDLMTSYKESALLKAELQETKHKLTSIENNSFGSNDMVIALKAELEAAEQAKLELQDQIAGLEKELENAAEAGLELNKMVAELLNQNGSDSIALSVEELQRQLNEQQQTILSMNASLAEKSRENSELQIAIGNQTGKFNERLEELEKARTELTDRRKQLEEEVASLQSEQRTKVDSMRKETGAEIDRLTKELKTAQSKADESRKALVAMEAKCEALEECIKEVKSDGGNTGKGMIDSIELKAQIALLTKEKVNMQDKLQGEIIARQLVEDHMKMVNEEISTLKREYGKAEKDKLEAETRLEVLSSYFKDKETQLQKELSVKEAMWMQQQGETTTTVEKIRHMQDEIQQLKSQNDKLRAEIEAQATAHKAQYTTLETRSHDAWLTARQAERRLEEARSESSALRRKLTALGDISASSDGMVNLPNASITQTDLGLTAPSPIRVESPNAPQLLGVLPPPPFMPPFMPGPPPPFMPPFMPPPHGPGEMRPPPLGRLMSPPPPPNNRYSPNNIIDARDRYSPDRGRYSPDSRYDYSVMSTYETENDFSPPPSPPHHTRHSNYDRDRERERDRDRDRDRERDRDRGSDRERPHRDGRGSGSGGYSRGYTPTGMRTSPPIQDPRNKKYAGGFSSGSQDSLGTRKSSGKYRGTGKPVL
ncbi:transport and Golgi organization protein 1 isoform X2 [Anopheles funestus]|uniref:transport and Golgi organization protein 1 isoform X2 n=1 Tax=Anopheles funestus TaxID=62324 RepID=UPI0020C69AC1|nr:transport and Golgi organization protein 1 isoform X2 [Anopheles funestus]